MRLLITGGAGFIGSNLVPHLLERTEAEIRVLDNESMGSREWLPASPRVEFIKGDFGDRNLVDRSLEEVETVIHLAADTRVIDSIEDPAKNFRINVENTFALLEAARRNGAKRFVFASTGGAIVGEAEPPVHEEIVPRPLAPYGASKLAIEGYLSAYAGSYGMQTCALRFSNVYGPNSARKQSAVAAFFKRILKREPITIYGDGSQIRDYLFVGDVATGIEQALGAGSSGVFQLASAKPTSLLELVDTMTQVVSDRFDVDVVFEPARAGEVQATWCDTSRAREAFGFEAATSLEAGLSRTWDWFVSQHNQ